MSGIYERPTIITVYKSGGAFGPEYVTNLVRSVEAALEDEHRFVVLTDDVSDLPPWIETESLRHDWPRWWSKAEIFRPDLERFGRMLYIDLSSVIVGQIDDLAGYRGEACVTRDFYCGGPSQSVLNFAPGSLRCAWDKMIADPEGVMAEGDKMIAPNFHDQILMADLEWLDYWQDVTPDQVVSFKLHCEQGIPENARIVKFHGKPKPHEIIEGWVKHVWAEGKSRINFIPRANVANEISLEHMRLACERDLPWIEPVAKRHGRPLALVGGGPSLAETWGQVRFIKLNGGHVWALNGTHDYLIERALIPNAMVMLDSREENVQFVQNPRMDVTYYIAARCHPAVFDALEGYSVVLWHSFIDGAEDLKIICDRPAVLVGGGSTVGLRAMYLAWVVLGYTRLALFGYDSSYRGDENHAYEQALNAGDTVMPVYANGEKFMATAWMGNQVQGFMEQARQMIPEGCEIKVFGDGLLPHVAKLLSEPPDTAPAIANDRCNIVR